MVTQGELDTLRQHAQAVREADAAMNRGYLANGEVAKHAVTAGYVLRLIAELEAVKRDEDVPLPAA